MYIPMEKFYILLAIFKKLLLLQLDIIDARF